MAIFLHPLEVNGKNTKLDGYRSPILILPSFDWPEGDGRSTQEQAYFHSVLETYGFILYGAWPRVPKFEQQFSDIRLCVDKNKDRKWPLFGWFFAKSSKASAAAQMIGNVGAMREAWHTQFENGEEEQ